MLNNNIRISDITKTKKGFNALFANDEFLFSVDDITLINNKIKIGSCYTQQELDCILKNSQNAKAVEKAYNYLSFRSHGKKELYRKLSRTFDKDIAQNAVDKMEDMGFIDDEKFAGMMAKHLIETKKSSQNQTKMKLMSLGIDKDIVDSVLSNFDSETQNDNIVKLLNTKYKSKLDNVDKVIQSLMRKGYRYGEIKSALTQIEDVELEDYYEY